MRFLLMFDLIDLLHVFSTTLFLLIAQSNRHATQIIVWCRLGSRWARNDLGPSRYYDVPGSPCLCKTGPAGKLQYNDIRMLWSRVLLAVKACSSVLKNKKVLVLHLTSYDRAEIENVNYASGDIFNFSSATRVCFSTFFLQFSGLWTRCQKNAPRIFDTSFIDKFWWNLASCIAPTLKLMKSFKQSKDWLWKLYLNHFPLHNWSKGRKRTHF